MTVAMGFARQAQPILAAAVLLCNLGVGLGFGSVGFGGLGFESGIALAAERHADSGPLGDELTRQEIAGWHDKLYESTNAFHAPGGGSSALRGWAMMALAMFEASNTIDRTYTVYAVPAASVPSTIDLDVASKRVAVAKAAQVVLDGLFAPPPSEPASALADLRRTAHATQFAVHTAALDPASAAYTNGAALGSFIGRQILANRADDGHPPLDPKVVNGTRWDQYQYGLPYYPDEPQSSGYPGVRPFGLVAFGLAGGDVTFVVPPLPNDSPAFKAQWEELYGYGTSNAARSTRTAETDATARFHDGNFGSQIGNTIDLLTSTEIRQTGTDLLRIIALTAMSTHDAHANHWFWKYFYRFGRPITQYRQVPPDQPNGLGALHDDAWQPVLTTSANPEYPSGHATRTGALTASLRKAFGDNLTFRTGSFSEPGAPPRTYASFTALQDEVMISRTYGGVHWRHSGPPGRDMAQRVTDYIWNRYLQKVPAEAKPAENK
jgi:PAP2 superfamily